MALTAERGEGNATLGTEKQMSKYTKEDETHALDAFHAAKAEVMAFAKAWHAKLEAGSLPTSDQVAEFQKDSAALNKKFKEACDRYYEVKAAVQLP